VRFTVSIIKVIRLKRKYTIEKIEDIDFINTNEPGTPFSFFKNLFWNRQIELNSVHGQQIFRHELFHIRQKHSTDILFTEIITVIFWMNPFFFLMKKEIKAIHEFLADGFAINKNDEWSYAELLLMQVLGSSNHLTNHFFHNQIKRRITMITTSQRPNYQYLRKLLVLPVAIFITALFAFKYKPKESYSLQNGTLEKPVTVIIDAGHGDSDPGIIANDGTRECDLTLQLAQKIKLLNKNDRIHIVLTRNNKETVDLKTRTAMANAQHPDLFISLHVSANDVNQSADASGFEVYISKKNTSYAAGNKILGGILLNSFSNLYKTTDKIQQRDMGIWVLDNSNCPSVLVECGYMTNKEDLAFVKNSSNQNKIAEAILNSIEQYSTQK
jgi:N-acetylmuramoyl-L-alanine amidase